MRTENWGPNRGGADFFRNISKQKGYFKIHYDWNFDQLLNWGVVYHENSYNSSKFSTTDPLCLTAFKKNSEKSTIPTLGAKC